MASPGAEHKQTSPAASAVRSAPVELVLPLTDFLDFFPRPHVGRIVSGLDVLTRPECGVAPNAVFTFRRCSSERRLIWKPACGHQVSVDVPASTHVQFRLLASGEGRYSSVAELADAFPTCPVRVDSIKTASTSPVRVGDRLRVVRLVWRNGEKCVECRRCTDRRLIDLPLSSAVEFVQDGDSRLMTFAELSSLCLPPRLRRVQLYSDVEGLPPGAGQSDGPPGQLYVGVEPTSSAVVVEASPVDDVVTLVRLPGADQRILVAPDAPTTLRPGHSLSSVVTNSRNMFPLVVRVVDWRRQPAILEQHNVRPGVELVLHRRVQLTKVSVSRASDICNTRAIECSLVNEHYFMKFHLKAAWWVIDQWFLTWSPGTPWGSQTPILGVPNANLEYQQISANISNMKSIRY